MMRTVCFHPAAVVGFTLIALSLGCNKSPKFSMVGGGTSVTADGWWFSSGSIFLQPREPGVLFGMQKPPGGERAFSYVVIFRHSVTENGVSVTRPENSGTRFDGRVATMSDGIVINGKGFRIGLDLHVNNDASTIESVKIIVDGKDIDSSNGRLFLVDLSSGSVTYKQVSAEFSLDLPDPQTTASVMTLARQLTQQLKCDNENVRAFLSK